jgi:hypothetical protein
MIQLSFKRINMHDELKNIKNYKYEFNINLTINEVNFYFL